MGSPFHSILWIIVLLLCWKCIHFYLFILFLSYFTPILVLIVFWWFSWIFLTDNHVQFMSLFSPRWIFSSFSVQLTVMIMSILLFLTITGWFVYFIIIYKSYYRYKYISRCNWITLRFYEYTCWKFSSSTEMMIY